MIKERINNRIFWSEYEGKKKESSILFWGIHIKNKPSSLKGTLW